MKLMLSMIVLMSLGFQAQAYESVQDVIRVKCEGKIDNFIINLSAFVNPQTMKIVSSKIDLGYKVQVWTSEKTERYTVIPKVTGGYIGVEAAVEGDSAKYKIDLPDYNYAYNQQTSSFTTRLTLKAGVVNGDLAVDCQAGLEKVKINSEISQ